MSECEDDIKRLRPTLKPKLKLRKVKTEECLREVITRTDLVRILISA